MIRPYQHTDLDQLITIWLECSVLAHAFIDSEYWERNAGVMRAVYIPMSKTFVWQDEQTKEIQGFISMVGSTVAALFIAPKAQGRGIGKALINSVKRQYPLLDLFVYCLNTRAHAFYRKQGFLTLEIVTDPNTGEDQYHMVYQ